MNDRGKVADEANPNGEECEEGENGKNGAPSRTSRPSLQLSTDHRPVLPKRDTARGRVPNVLQPSEFLSFCYQCSPEPKISLEHGALATIF